MSTRVHTQAFQCETCAKQAQKEMRCAECAERLKVHYVGGWWYALCMKNMLHKDIREVLP